MNAIRKGSPMASRTRDRPERRVGWGGGDAGCPGSLPPMVAHALRAVVLLTTIPRDRMLTARAICRTTGAPHATLAKALSRLVAAGLLRARKGHRGGFVLAHAAESIRVVDVFEAVGWRPGITCCAVRTDGVVLACPLRRACDTMRRRYDAWAAGSLLGVMGGGGNGRRGPSQPPWLRVAGTMEGGS